VLGAIQQKQYDVVLMDIEMPVMDGLQATMAIRSSEQGSAAHLPIVAMTAHAMKGDREQFITAGIDDYVSKPLRLRELRAALQRVTAGD
jgi:CheY-like chemotaxis protein